jgi:hypothetical protein
MEPALNLADMGWAAVRVVPVLTRNTTPTSVCYSDHEAMVNACGVAVAKPQRNSWAPILPTGSR